VDSNAYQEYRCGASEVFDGLTLCVKRTDDTESRGPFIAYDGLLHSRDGTVVYVSRYQDPAYWRDDEAEEDIGYYSRELGEAPTFLMMPTRDELPNAVIATWGKIVLEPVDGASQKILAAGKNPKIGALIDFLGNYELSTKNDLPVYRVSGGAGFIWAASWDSDGRGNLRMLAINPSELPTPANLNPPDQAEANLSASNPLASFAHKPLDEGARTGFFVSAEGHILTNAGIVSDCPSIVSSHGGHITKIAFDETSDLALLMSSEKPNAWASFRGGIAPQVAEPVMTIGFPVGTISALARLGKDRRMIQIRTQTQLQNTGSPLLDRSGNVVGIVSDELNRTQVAETTSKTTENVNFAVNLGTLQSFLDSHAVPYVSNDSTQSKNYADIATEAMRYTVLLECAR
jgi:S1-C subfamily serine protease